MWSGSDGFSTTTPSPTVTYTTEGVKSATATITDGSQSLALTCQAKVADTTGSSCFIATAVFGTPLAPEINVLRNFRDQSLETNRLGQMAVDAYYSVSPPIADYIRDKEYLKSAVRLVLDPIVYVLEAVGYEEVRS